MSNLPAGAYTITVGKKTQALIFSFVGYTPRNIPINGKDIIDVTLEPQNGTLNDVILIGYGTSRKKDLTGSIASISQNRWI